MDREEIEKELREYLLAEVKEVEPAHGWWGNVISRLGTQKQRSRWFRFMPKTRLAWALLPLILLFIGGTVYGASSLIGELFQKYATDVEEAGLAQELDLNQTINGVTVSLERAYADANVVLVGFTVSGPKDRYYVEVGELSTTDGQSLPGMLGLSTVPGSDIILGSWSPSERVAMMSSFDASSLAGVSPEVSLRFETYVSDSGVPRGNQASVGPFSFDFNLPFHSGKVVDIGQTVEAADIPITLEKIVMSPWATRAVLSLSPQYDDSKKSLALITSVQPAGGDDKSSSFGSMLESSRVEYYIGDFTEQPGEWTVTVRELVFIPKPSGQKVEIHPPSDTERLAGPWVFHFEVP